MQMSRLGNRPFLLLVQFTPTNKALCLLTWPPHSQLSNCTKSMCLDNSAVWIAQECWFKKKAEHKNNSNKTNPTSHYVISVFSMATGNTYCCSSVSMDLKMVRLKPEELSGWSFQSWYDKHTDVLQPIHLLSAYRHSCNSTTAINLTVHIVIYPPPPSRHTSPHPPTHYWLTGTAKRSSQMAHLRFYLR